MKTPVSTMTLEQAFDASDSTSTRFGPAHTAAGLQQEDLTKGWRSFGHRSVPGAIPAGVAPPAAVESIHGKLGSGFRIVAYGAGRNASARASSEQWEYGAMARYVVPAAMVQHGDTSWYARDGMGPDTKAVPGIDLPSSHRKVADALLSAGGDEDQTAPSLLRVVLADPSRPPASGAASVCARAQAISDWIGAELSSGPWSTVSDKDDARFPSRLDKSRFSFEIINHLPLWEILNATTHEGIIGALRRSGMDGVAERLTYLRSVAADDPEEPSMSLESLREFAQFLVNQRKLPRPRVSVSPDGLAHAEWRLRSKGLLAMQFKPTGDIRFSAISRPWQDGIRREVLHGTRPKTKALESLHDFMSQISDR